MKLKLDENIGRRGLDLIRAAGHDVATVLDQSLGGTTDETPFEACAKEGRALVTLDRDFGHVTRFPPHESAGVVILEVGPRTTVHGVVARIRDFLAILETRSVSGALWIVEPGRVRIHIRDDEE